MQIKVTPVTDFADEPVIQFNIPIAQNNFVGDYIIIHKNGK